MRDAFGGIFMIRLMLVFVFIFVAFTAISLNYAKAFRIKNKIIDIIEQEEIMDLDAAFASGRGTVPNKIKKVVDDAQYKTQCAHDGALQREPLTGRAYCYSGIIIEESDRIDRTIVYNVRTYVGWDLGIISSILSLGGQSRNSKDILNGSWEISGEARVVERKYNA